MPWNQNQNRFEISTKSMQTKVRNKQEIWLSRFLISHRTARNKKNEYPIWVDSRRMLVTGRRFYISSRGKENELGMEASAYVCELASSPSTLCAQLLPHSLCSLPPFARSLPLNATPPSTYRATSLHYSWHYFPLR